MHHVCAPKRLLTGLLVSLVAALVVQVATAAPRVHPSLRQSQYRYHDGMWVARTSSTRIAVIPYLSHGVGVNRTQYRYHDGMWVARASSKQQSALRPDDRAGRLGI
jgi:hypothetical protein